MHSSSVLRRTALAASSLLGLALLLVVSVPGCGDDAGGTGGGSTEPPPAGRCNEDPLACEEGTVCAFDDEDGASMTCLPKGSKGKGEKCQNVESKPECGANLICLQIKGDPDGTCTPYCDGADDCSGGLECATVTTDGGKQFFACAKT